MWTTRQKRCKEYEIPSRTIIYKLKGKHSSNFERSSGCSAKKEMNTGF